MTSDHAWAQSIAILSKSAVSQIHIWRSLPYNEDIGMAAHKEDISSQMPLPPGLDTIEDIV